MEWMELIAVAGETILATLAFTFLYKLYRNKDFYPIKQLSPIITIFQGLSFFVFQFVLVALYFVQKLLEINIDWNQCSKKNVHIEKNETLYLIIIFIYLFSRGCCFSFTFIKTFKVLLAFSDKRLSKNQFLVKRFNDEIFLLIFGTYYAFIGFPIMTSLSTRFTHDFPIQCCLQVYENNSGHVMWNSWIEEGLTLILIWKVRYFQRQDKLIKLTINLQFAYVMWFLINSLADKFLIHLPNILIYIWISCWLRCIVMFYFFVIEPCLVKEQHPTIYITAQQIDNFEIVISKQFNSYYPNNYTLQLFKKYLHCYDNLRGHSASSINSIQSLLEYSQLELFKIFESIQDQLQTGEDHFRADDHFFNILQINKKRSISLENANIIEIGNQLFNHFQRIYVENFQKCQAYQTLRQQYFLNEILQENFKQLNIGLKQFIPFQFTLKEP